MKSLKKLPPEIVVEQSKKIAQASITPPSAYPMRSDPILQELWAIKAQLNKEAHYDAATLLRNAQRVVNNMRAA